MKKRIYILTKAIFSSYDDNLYISTTGCYDNFAEAFSTMEREANDRKKEITANIKINEDEISIEETTESMVINTLYLNDELVKWIITETTI